MRLKQKVVVWGRNNPFFTTLIIVTLVAVPGYLRIESNIENDRRQDAQLSKAFCFAINDGRVGVRTAIGEFTEGLIKASTASQDSNEDQQRTPEQKAKLEQDIKNFREDITNRLKRHIPNVNCRKLLQETDSYIIDESFKQLNEVLVSIGLVKFPEEP